MDPNKLKEFADAAFDRELHRKNIKESADALLSVPLNGGLFIATPTLIAFLNSWDEADLVVEDFHKNPIKVNRVELLTKLKEAYQISTSTWCDNFQVSNAIRRASNV